MKSLRVVVVDDEPLARSRLKRMLQNIGNVDIAGECANGHQAIEQIPKIQPDVLLLDVQMPEMNGFDFIGSIESPPNIIIISSAEEYALKAFDFNAVDYLLKPISYSRFCKAIDKVSRYYSRREAPATGNEEIFIKNGSSLVKLKLRDIIYVEALENYVTLNTSDEKYTIHFTMKAIESQLPSGVFIRVHRSFIVNKGMIQSIRENTLDLNVGNTVKSIPVGKSYRDSLLNEINVMAR